jgi:hypothetical protein
MDRNQRQQLMTATTTTAPTTDNYSIVQTDDARDNEQHVLTTE